MDQHVEPHELSEKPTRVRYNVLRYMCALSFVLYLDRVCISQALPAIREELNLDKTQMGYVLVAFTVAYALFEVPTGRWGDRFGSRGVLTRVVIWWSAFTALTGAVNGLLVLVAVRFLFGAGEAGAYPNVVRVLARWMPASERGAAQGFVIASAQIGATIAPIAAAKCIKEVGWRLTFLLFGLLGIVWAAAFWNWFRDDPAQHPSVNNAELRLIASGLAAPATHLPLPWANILTSANIWLITLAQSCSAFAAYLYITWYPTYLMEGRGVSSDEAGWLASLVLGGGAIGCLAGGFVNDWLVRLSGNARRSYSLYGFFGLATGGVALLASTQCESPLAASVCAAVASMAALSTQATFWSVTTLISGPHLGAIFGLMNSMSVPGAAASSYFPGRFADYRSSLGFTGREQWDPAFYVYATVLLCGAVCWLFVNSNRSVVGDQTRQD